MTFRVTPRDRIHHAGVSQLSKLPMYSALTGPPTEVRRLSGLPTKPGAQGSRRKQADEGQPKRDNMPRGDSGLKQADEGQPERDNMPRGDSGLKQADSGQPERDNVPRGGFRGVVPPGQQCSPPGRRDGVAAAFGPAAVAP